MRGRNLISYIWVFLSTESVFLLAVDGVVASELVNQKRETFFSSKGHLGFYNVIC